MRRTKKLIVAHTGTYCDLTDTEVDVLVAGEYNPGSAGRTCCAPEDAYPPEPACVEGIDSIAVDGVEIPSKDWHLRFSDDVMETMLVDLNDHIEDMDWED